MIDRPVAVARALSGRSLLAQLEQGLTRLRATNEGLTVDVFSLPLSVGASEVLPSSSTRPRLAMAWFGVVVMAGFAISWVS